MAAIMEGPQFSMMRAYEYVDAFIADTCEKIGDTFTVGDLRAWRDEKGFDFHAGQALIAHRDRPDDRAFSTERVGMGKLAFHRVVDMNGADKSAVERMHKQQAREAARRWRKERETRMEPLARKSRKAQRALREAEAQMAAVFTLLEVRLADDDDE